MPVSDKGWMRQRQENGESRREEINETGWEFKKTQKRREKHSDRKTERQETSDGTSKSRNCSIKEEERTPRIERRTTADLGRVDIQGA